MKEEQIQQDLKDILGSFEITTQPAKTLLVAVMVADDGHKNTQQKVGCYHGTPITGYAYSVKDDAYLIPCVEAKELGWINQTFYISVPLTGSWRLPLPLPPVVIERYLTAAQRKTIKDLKEKYPGDGYKLHFVQMQSCEK